LHSLVLGRKQGGAAFSFAANRNEGVAPDAAQVAKRLGYRFFPSGSMMHASGGTWHKVGPEKPN
jgi:hypothetical protein